uniref:Uncharacterized protein n=1 Tax=Rhizophora mucronata TaxID=61149 RepID=A0A2P2PFU1_RHIMU
MNLFQNLRVIFAKQICYCLVLLN